MKALMRLFGTLIPVILFLNVAGGVVGGIWVAIRGDWWAIGYVVFGIIASRFIIGIGLMPGLAIGAAAAAAMERRKPLIGRIGLTLSTLYTNAVMVGWAILVTILFINHQRSVSLFPILLLAYGSSTGPWAFLANEDQRAQGGNEFSAISVFLLQAGYVIAAAMLLLNPDNGYFFLVPLLVTMGLNWLLQQLVLKEMVSEASARMPA